MYFAPRTGKIQSCVYCTLFLRCLIVLFLKLYFGSDVRHTTFFNTSTVVFFYHTHYHNMIR